MKKLDIIYEDKDILVVNKPAKLLTIADNKERVKTLYHEVREYLHKKNQKVFIVHRLDKDTSGIVLFAKNEKLKKLLQENWYNYKREYIAVVEGHLKEKKGTIKCYLQESKTNQVYVSSNGKGKLAITDYELINSNKSSSLVKINIKTGRKNQIRASMAYLGNPIVGDKKYDSKLNTFKRLALHHTKLEIIHPLRKKESVFISNPPEQFLQAFSK